MDLNLSVPMEEEVLCPKITVIGVGGAGGNAVNNMISSNLEGVEFVVANTDAQAMQQSLCERRIQLGRNITAGLGAGSRPDVGRAAAEESLDDILRHLEGANMCSSPLAWRELAPAPRPWWRAAREADSDRGVVNPSSSRASIAREWPSRHSEPTQYVDTLIIIPTRILPPGDGETTSPMPSRWRTMCCIRARGCN